MFKKSIILSISIFLILSVATSMIKNSSRNLEKDISKLKKEIVLLEKEKSDAEIDFIYLSNPEQLTKNLEQFKNREEYITFDRSRIFFSIHEFLYANSKVTKHLKEKFFKW